MSSMTIAGGLDTLQARDAPWACATCGNGSEASCPVLTPACSIDAELVIARLEAAGATLLAMRGKSPWPSTYRCALPEVLHEAVEAYGYTEAEIRPAVPDARAITRMDAAWRWLGLIPQHRFVLRRIVAVRALVSPTTGKHLVYWRRVGEIIGADYRAAQRWHAQGIGLIVTALRNGC